MMTFSWISKFPLVLIICHCDLGIFASTRTLCDVRYWYLNLVTDDVFNIDMNADQLNLKTSIDTLVKKASKSSEDRKTDCHILDMYNDMLSETFGYTSSAMAPVTVNTVSETDQKLKNKEIHSKSSKEMATNLEQPVQVANMDTVIQEDTDSAQHEKEQEKKIITSKSLESSDQDPETDYQADSNTDIYNFDSDGDIIHGNKDKGDIKEEEGLKSKNIEKVDSTKATSPENNLQKTVGQDSFVTTSDDKEIYLETSVDDTEVGIASTAASKNVSKTTTCPATSKSVEYSRILMNRTSTVNISKINREENAEGIVDTDSTTEYIEKNIPHVLGETGKKNEESEDNKEVIRRHENDSGPKGLGIASDDSDESVNRFKQADELNIIDESKVGNEAQNEGKSTDDMYNLHAPGHKMKLETESYNSGTKLDVTNNQHVKSTDNSVVDDSKTSHRKPIKENDNTITKQIVNDNGSREEKHVNIEVQKNSLERTKEIQRLHKQGKNERNDSTKAFSSKNKIYQRSALGNIKTVPFGVCLLSRCKKSDIFNISQMKLNRKHRTSVKRKVKEKTKPFKKCSRTKLIKTIFYFTFSFPHCLSKITHLSHKRSIIANEKADKEIHDDVILKTVGTRNKGIYVKRKAVKRYKQQCPSNNSSNIICQLIYSLRHCLYVDTFTNISETLLENKNKPTNETFIKQSTYFKNDSIKNLELEDIEIRNRKKSEMKGKKYIGVISRKCLLRKSCCRICFLIYSIRHCLPADQWVKKSDTHAGVKKEIVDESDDKYIENDITSRSNETQELKRDVVNEYGEIWLNENISKDTVDVKKVETVVEADMLKTKYEQNVQSQRINQDKSENFQQFSVENLEKIVNKQTDGYWQKIQNLELMIIKLENQVLTEKLQKQNYSSTITRLENMILKLENDLLRMNRDYETLKHEADQFNRKHSKYLEITQNETQRIQKYPELPDEALEHLKSVPKHQSILEELSETISNQTTTLDHMKEKTNYLEDQNNILQRMVMNQTTFINQILQTVTDLAEQNSKHRQEIVDLRLKLHDVYLNEKRLESPDVYRLPNRNDKFMQNLDALASDGKTDGETFDLKQINKIIKHKNKSLEPFSTYWCKYRSSKSNSCLYNTLVNKSNCIPYREIFWEKCFSNLQTENEEENVKVTDNLDLPTITDNIKDSSEDYKISLGHTNIASQEDNNDHNLPSVEDKDSNVQRGRVSDSESFQLDVKSNDHPNIFRKHLETKAESLIKETHSCLAPSDLCCNGNQVKIFENVYNKKSMPQEKCSGLLKYYKVKLDVIDAKEAADTQDTSQREHNSQGNKNNSLKDKHEQQNQMLESASLNANAIEGKRKQRQDVVVEHERKDNAISITSRESKQYDINQEEYKQTNKHAAEDTGKTILDGTPITNTKSNNITKDGLDSPADNGTKETKKKVTESEINKKETKHVTRKTPLYLIKEKPKEPKDCYDHYSAGSIRDGVYKVKPARSKSFIYVYCDMKQGGWMVIQIRRDGKTDFFQDWETYKKGFGSVYDDHWLGNENIHQITNQDYYNLRVELRDWNKTMKVALYDYMLVDSEEEGYRLHIAGYSGDAGDGLSKHDSSKFSTKDVDNDKVVKEFGGSCAKRFHGAGWYYKCYASNLNGKYYRSSKIPEKLCDGITWKPWTGPNYSLKSVQLKIRPASANHQNASG